MVQASPVSRLSLYAILSMGLWLGACADPNITPPNKSASQGDDDSGVDIPGEVAGAYLSCTVDEDEIAIRDVNYVGTGCSLRKEEDNSKIALSKEIETKINVFNVFNQKIMFELEEAPKGSGYHWYIRVPIQEFKDSNVEAVITYIPTQAESKKVAFIVGDPKQISGRPVVLDRPVYYNNFGSDFDIHVGDVVDIDNAPQASVNRQCGSNRQKVAYSGGKVEINFEAPSKDTIVGITISEICGVSGISNEAKVFDANGKVASQSKFGVFSKTLKLDALDMPDMAGPIKLKLVFFTSRPFLATSYDDFIVGKIDFQTSKPITISSDVKVYPVEARTEGGEVVRDSVKSNIVDAPRNNSKTTKLSVRVGGNGIQKYRYRITTTNTCIGEDYSEPRSVSTRIADDISSLPDGPVKICVVGMDTENYWQPKAKATQASWTKDTKVDPPKVKNAPRGENNQTSLNLELESSDMERYRYKLGVLSQTACHVNSGYSKEVSKRDNIQQNISSIPDGDIRLCIVATDNLGNTQPLDRATMVTWTKDTQAPQVKLAGVPSGTSDAIALDVSVTDSGLDSYKFKVGAETSTDCSSQSGYSQAVAASQKITAKLDGLPNGSLKLCAVGTDKAGNSQAFGDATSAVWTKN